MIKEMSMATIRLAPVLRSSAGGSKQVNAQGGTLSEVLSDLFQRYPSLKEQIQPEEELSRFINVYVNDQDIRYLQGLETTVGPNDTIILLPAMAGGF
jgi:molybdopterin synthase sulfur carrier subunit